jgi:hypothetical protein
MRIIRLIYKWSECEVECKLLFVRVCKILQSGSVGGQIESLPSPAIAFYTHIKELQGKFSNRLHFGHRRAPTHNAPEGIQPLSYAIEASCSSHGGAMF